MLQKRLFGTVTVLILFARFAAASQAIDAKYKTLGAATLGKPSGAEKASAGGGRARLYANGGIYWSQATGTHAVYGPAFGKYKALGAERGKLGYPVTDVLTTSDGGTQTLFRHGYILVDKSGAASAEATPKATYTSDSVTYSGGAMPKMKSPTEAIVEALPQSSPGEQTVTCNCSEGMSLEFGICAISPAGISSIRCQKGTCRNGCVIRIVKHVQ